MKLTASILLSICACSAISAQPLATKLSTAWQRFEADPQLNYASMSLTVIDPRTGETVFSKNGNTGLAPASTLKTVTSATAFYQLGADFRFRTSLAWTGTIAPDGTLNGDLLIKGSGDPTLGSARYADCTEQQVLAEWSAAVKGVGIKKINGRVLGDDRLFGTETLPGGWIWSDIGNYYGAGAPALSWRENQFDMIFAPGAHPGDPVRSVRTDPAMPFLQLVNEVVTGSPGSGDGVIAYSAPYQPLVYLRGTHGIDLRKRIGAAVPDPAYEAAYRLKETLANQQIFSGEAGTVRQEQLEKRPVAATEHTFATHLSPTLARIVYWLNQKSINLYGELLLRQLAVHDGKEPTFDNGAAAVKTFWNTKLGIDKNSLNIIDGSGLSPATRVTTTTMAKILASLIKEPWFDDYYASLPVNNGVRMKSGTIQNALAYAGYQPSNGGMLAFSVIVNNYNGSSSAMRQKIFALLDGLK